MPRTWDDISGSKRDLARGLAACKKDRGVGQEPPQPTRGSNTLTNVERATDSILGLPPGVAKLRDHTSQWRQLYDEESLLITRTVGPLLVDIRHVGSTAIPNMKAKPIIDILAGVTSLECGLFLVVPLDGIGYTYLGEKLVSGHHVFAKGANRAYLLHAVAYESAAWTRIITFRKILEQNPQIAADYEALKIGLSAEFGENRTAYAEAKTPFIDRVLREASEP